MKLKWTVLFQYLLYSPDSSEGTFGETQSLLESGSHGKGSDNTTSQEKAGSKGSENQLREAINKALLSPPFLTVMLASLLAVVSSHCQFCVGFLSFFLTNIILTDCPIFNWPQHPQRYQMYLRYFYPAQGLCNRFFCQQIHLGNALYPLVV